MLARVPWMFLMLGAIYGVCGLVATLLISEPEDSASETMSFTSSDSEKSEEAAREIQTSLRPTEVLRTAVFYQVSTSRSWKTPSLIIISHNV